MGEMAMPTDEARKDLQTTALMITQQIAGDFPVDAFFPFDFDKRTGKRGPTRDNIIDFVARLAQEIVLLKRERDEAQNTTIGE